MVVLLSLQAFRLPPPSCGQAGCCLFNAETATSTSGDCLDGRPVHSKEYDVLKTRVAVRREYDGAMRMCNNCKKTWLRKGWTPPTGRLCFCCEKRGAHPTAPTKNKRTRVAKSHALIVQKGVPIGAYICRAHKLELELGGGLPNSFISAQLKHTCKPKPLTTLEQLEKLQKDYDSLQHRHESDRRLSDIAMKVAEERHKRDIEAEKEKRSREVRTARLTHKREVARNVKKQRKHLQAKHGVFAKRVQTAVNAVHDDHDRTVEAMNEGHAEEVSRCHRTQACSEIM